MDDNGDLIIAAVHDRAWKMDHNLIKLLLSDAEIKAKFFEEIEGHWIFNINTFLEYIMQKNFLDNSYTRFRNRIGLTIDGKYLSERGDVVLAWPYKDCVLEGRQTNEEEKREEIFFNEVLAQDEINCLFSPKVITNWQKFTSSGVEPIAEFEQNENGEIINNFIFRGNNLLVLSSICNQFHGRVKLVYIDPPYYFSDTKDGDTFLYNTNFKLSSWLVFMKNRLLYARKFLSEDGCIFVQVSDEGAFHLKLLLDETFGSENFLNVISVRMKNIAGASGGGEDKRLKKNIEFIFIYAKDIHKLSSFKKVYEYKELMKLIEEYRENNISWKYTSVLINPGTKQYILSTVDGEGNEIKVYERKGYEIKSVNQIMADESLSEKEVYYNYLDKIFNTVLPQSSIRPRVMNALGDKLIKDGFYSIEYIPRSGRNKGKVYEQFYKGEKARLLSWLSDVTDKQEGVIYKKELRGTYWDGFNLNNLSKEGKVELENGKKPEALLQQIIEMATDEGDLVLDYHLGSGTTAAVAHKMKRHYIGIEQLNYGENDSVVRLQNVIKGDQSGISKSVNWLGGGEFIYCELMKYNELYMDHIQDAQSSNELLEIWNQITEQSFLNWYVVNTPPEDAVQYFIEIGKEEGGLDKQKRLLAELLDKNQLYVNLSEIDDECFHVSEEDKALNRLFYGDAAHA